MFFCKIKCNINKYGNKKLEFYGKFNLFSASDIFVLRRVIDERSGTGRNIGRPMSRLAIKVFHHNTLPGLGFGKGGLPSLAFRVVTAVT